MLATELLEYIYNNDKTVEILEKLNCHNITSHSPKEYRCGLPNHTNKTAVVVKRNESLQVTVYSEEETIRGDLYTLIMRLNNFTFVETLKYLHKELNLNYKPYNKNNDEIVKKDNPLDIFYKAKPKKKQKLDVADIQYIDDVVFESYLPYLHINWFKEGILPFTRKAFNICYDEKTKRIAIPHYSPLEPDKIMGIMGRTVLPSVYCDMFDIPKYFPLQKFYKSLSLYGYAQNYKSIVESGIVLVGESEKFVLKLHSRKIENTVAIGSHCLSDEQIKLLIGLDCEIVLCYDKDVSLNHVLNECKRFNHIRKCSFMFDEWGLLKDKESPSDKELKIFNFMYKHRVTYSDKLHKEFLRDKDNI